MTFDELWKQLPIPGEYDDMDACDQARWRGVIELAVSMAAEQDRQDAELYRELIMAVGKKFPGESRHQTALRYIRQAEEPCGGTGNSVCAIRAEGKPI